MAAFQETRQQTEQKVLVHLLSEIEKNPYFTQRGLAQELGIALGLMNQYLRRCITKGWIRATQISPKRIKYFLTHEGFREKSHMVTSYLTRSLTFFRDAKQECEQIFSYCKNNNFSNVALIGASELAEIAELVAAGSGIKLTLVNLFSDLSVFDAVLITDIVNPQEAYDNLKAEVDNKRLLVLDLLHISKDKTCQV